VRVAAIFGLCASTRMSNCNPRGQSLRGFAIYNKAGDGEPSNTAMVVL
jgi:hypothetical protein